MYVFVLLLMAVSDILTLYFVGLFEGNKPKLSPASLPLPLPIGSGPRRRAHEMFMDPRFTPGASGSRAKATESTWTPEEDALLKRFVEKYPYNWVLIAEAFNLAKVTIPLERRSPVECYERWKAKFGPNAPAEEEHRPPPTPTTSMTTRGTKRSLSTSVNASSGTGSAFESKKKRRHTIMHEAIRKVVKKREQAQRANGTYGVKLTCSDFTQLCTSSRQPTTQSQCSEQYA